MKDIIEDTYQITTQEATGEYKEKGSKFLAYSYPITTLEEFDLCMETLRSEHPKARHFCYAYRLGLGGKQYRANDDGEPSGTAGKPILGQLLSHDVSDTLVVVVRYFGGTKLGASGLITAYKTAANEVLTIAPKSQKTLNDRFKITFAYSQMGHLLNVIKSMDIEILEKVFEAEAFIVIEIPKSEVNDTYIELKANLLQVSPEQVDIDTEIPFCTIQQISDND